MGHTLAADRDDNGHLETGSAALICGSEWASGEGSRLSDDRIGVLWGDQISIPDDDIQAPSFVGYRRPANSSVTRSGSIFASP
jgi:hypothetical protein